MRTLQDPQTAPASGTSVNAQPDSRAKTEPEVRPCLYLDLFHGRKDPHQIMGDGGVEGPVFGPYEHVHTTYRDHIKMGRPDGGVDQLWWGDNDLIFYDGMYHGDMSVFAEPDPSRVVERLQPFVKSKTGLWADQEVTRNEKPQVG